jgi:flagellar motor protein MotB
MKNRYAAVCGVLVLLSACVSSKKYQALSNRYENLSQRFVADTIRYAQKNSELTSLRDSVFAKYTKLENTYLQLKNDSITLSQNYRRNKALLDDLFEKYDQLDKSYKQLSSSLSSDAVTQTQNVSQKEKDLLILEQKLLAQQSKNDKLSVELQEREVRMIAFENSIRRMNKSASDVKARLEKALAISKDTTLKVEQREAGRVAVCIPRSLLFSGSSETISPQGAAILRKIAFVYKAQSGFVYTLSTVLSPVSTQLTPSEAGTFPDMYEIYKFFSKESVTFSKITVTPRYEAKAATSAKKVNENPENRLIEILSEPKLDVILQNLQSN